MTSEIIITVPSDDMVTIATLALFIGHAVGEFSHLEEADALGMIGYRVNRVED